MTTPHATNISQRLLFSMLVIVISLLFLSVPLISISHQKYHKTNDALTELQVLQALTETANKISKERAPANKAMSSSPETLARHQQALYEYRQGVDAHIQFTTQLLQQAGFTPLAKQLKTQINDLYAARKVVDQYVALPYASKTVGKMDHAIMAMFSAWDSCFVIVKQFVNHSKGDNSQISNYFTLILILADMRDQAGRVASQMIAPVTFMQAMPDNNRDRSIQSQEKTRYLWDLLNTLQPEKEKTTEFIQRHQRVETQFLNQGIPIVSKLLDQGQFGNHYELTGTQLTEAIVDKFTPVVELQRYILQHSVDVALQQKRSAGFLLILAILVSLLSLCAALFTMLYARKRVFIPLIQAREAIFALSETKNNPLDLQQATPKYEFFPLFEAIHKLQVMLQQRDEMEFKLKQIANSDALTGVSNRLVLEEYIAILENDPSKLAQTSLIVIDIDDFKQVNDRYGHLAGDYMITYVANQLKANVRTTDLIIRYGGDEFLILIDHIHLEQTINLAENIRRAISQSAVTIPNSSDQINISISIGIASGAGSWVELMENADQSLFKAKAMGKNAIAY
jgi:diguanylate cyclase (GGDEF)-like protein